MKKYLVVLLMVAMCLSVFANGTAENPVSAEVIAENPKAAWPTGDVRIIVPNPAGGASDAGARLFADYVSKNSGKNVIVVNETGGGNTVGFETVRNGKNDGSVLLSFHGTALLNYFSGKVKYSITDPAAYTFINFIYEPNEKSVNCIAVSAKSPYMTIDDLIEAAKANPGKISCGDGFGSSAFIISGQLELAADCKFKHVDAPDTTTRITSIIGGQIDWAPLGYKQALPYVESGDIRLLAMDGTSDFDPAIPTLESKGYSGVGFPSYGFIAGPANMDPAVVNAISIWAEEFCRDKKEDVEKIGFTTSVWTHDEALARESQVYNETLEVTKALGW